MINIQVIAENAAKLAGCELYDVVIVNGKSEKSIRVFIDKNQGVGIDDCATVSRILNEELEKDTILNDFSLEVSSPGLERDLKTLKHYSSVIDKNIQFKTLKTLAELGYKHQNFSNAKNFSAVLKEVKESSVVVEVFDQELVIIPLSEIIKANLIFDFEKPKSKKGSR